MKTFTLHIGHVYSLVNDTDADPMTDYFPAIWGITTQKQAIAYAQEELAEGNIVKLQADNDSYQKTLERMKNKIFNK